MQKNNNRAVSYAVLLFFDIKVSVKYDINGLGMHIGVIFRNMLVAAGVVVFKASAENRQLHRMLRQYQKC